jgi:hypothetical protein
LCPFVLLEKVDRKLGRPLISEEGEAMESGLMEYSAEAVEGEAMESGLMEYSAEAVEGEAMESGLMEYSAEAVRG